MWKSDSCSLNNKSKDVMTIRKELSTKGEVSIVFETPAEMQVFNLAMKQFSQSLSLMEGDSNE